MKDQVKVLLVTSHPVQYAAPLYRRYAEDPRLNITVAYCSLHGAEPGIDPEFGVEIAWNIPLLNGYKWIHPRNVSPRPGLRGFFGLLNPGLWGLIKRGQFDIVVCFGWRTASFWISVAAAKASGAALVFTTDAHTLMPRNGSPWKVPVKRIMLPLILRLADAVLGPSSRTLALLRSLGLSEGRTFLTPFVVNNGFFEAGAGQGDRDSLRHDWAIPTHAPAALFVGKLVPWKRPQDLLEAGARVPGLYLFLAGEGPLRSLLEARAASEDLGGRVRFLGFVNQRQLPSVYAAADFLVLPSDYEPFGVVVNEAFSCGLPAIVSEACGSAGDLVRNGETGYVVPVGAVDVLAERLRTLAADTELRGEMAQRARARIADWGPQQNAEAFAQACLSIARRKS